MMELLLVAVGLSMDAFAVAVCRGLAAGGSRTGHAVITGLFFGGFQALMPLAGYLLGAQFRDYITPVDHWIVFALLSLIGLNMIRESRSKCCNSACDAGNESLYGPGPISTSGPKPGKPLDPRHATSYGMKPGNRSLPKPGKSFDLRTMLAMSVATSIDALAVGVSFAFLNADILRAVSVIGMTTFILSALGFKIGSVFGTRFKSRAEAAGGIILIAMGLKILVEHLGA